MDYDQLKVDSIGRWPGIYESLGIDVGNGKHKSCPACRNGVDRFRFTNETGRGEWFCNTGHPKRAGDGFGLVMAVLGVDFKDACEEVAKIIGNVEPSKYQKEKPVSPDFLRKMFKESVPVSKGDTVFRYFLGRGLSSLPEPLRYMKKCWEPETKKDQEAMLALFQLSSGEAVTMQRTYLGDGDKLNIDHPRKIVPPLKKMTGGAVRLYKYESGLLGVAEGIETAVALHEKMGFPVWATLSTALMESFVPPPEVTNLAIFADNDHNYAGQRAAYALAHRMMTGHNKLKTVEVEIPDVPGEDFLDEVNRTEG